jgi:hypothetical protein
MKFNLNDLGKMDLSALMSKKGDDSVTLSKWQYDTIMDRMDKLQAAADKYHVYDLEQIRATSSMADANALRQTYDTDWFINCQYSDEIIRKLATALLDASELYFPGNPLWISASQGNYPIDPGLPVPELKNPSDKPWKDPK